MLFLLINVDRQLLQPEMLNAWLALFVVVAVIAVAICFLKSQIVIVKDYNPLLLVCLNLIMASYFLDWTLFARQLTLFFFAWPASHGVTSTDG